MPIGNNPKPLKRVKKASAFSYPIEKNIALVSINEELIIPFNEVLNQRHSSREFNKIDLQTLSNLLWYSAKVRSISITKEGNLLTKRVAPSAGAIHPIDILVSTSNVISERELCYYNPFTHSLAKLKLNKDCLIDFFNKVDNCLNLKDATLIWFVAHINRTASKYANPRSLIWRDAGALIMTMQLVASGLNLNSCPIGTLAEPSLSSLFDDSKNIISAGGILVG